MLSSLVPHAHKAKYLLNAHSPTILTVFGVGGTVATAVLTGRASFKAAKLIQERSEELEAGLRFPEVKMEFSKTEKTKLVWKEFIPPVAVGVVTVASIIAANKISSTRIAALTVAAGVSERALTEYKDKVIEKLTPRQEEKIRDEIAEERVRNNPPSGQIVIAGGEVLCYDQLTGRYFKSTMEDVKRAENKLVREILNFNSASLSFFYDEIGLEPTSYTDSVGWNASNTPEVQFTTVLSTDDKPCLAIGFSKPPILDYDKHWDI